MTVIKLEEQTSTESDENNLDAQEVLEAIAEIRRNGGFGGIEIDIHKGVMLEIRVTHKRRPQTEARAAHYSDIIKKPD